MEQVLFRLHIRFSTNFCERINPRIRKLIENLSLLNAFISLFILLYLHRYHHHHHENRAGGVFYRSSYSNCLRNELANMNTSFLSTGKPYILKVYIANTLHDEYNWRKTLLTSSRALWKKAVHFDAGNLCLENSNSSVSISPQRRRLYVYSPKEKGYLYLPLEERTNIGIPSIELNIPVDSHCIGPSVYHRWFLYNFIGYDSVVINWFIDWAMHSSNSEYSIQSLGYIRSSISNEFFDLNQDIPNMKYDSLFALLSIGYEKCCLLATICFLFFLTTTIVSFTLRETQVRMLKFTFLLHHYIRQSVPYMQLIITHVVETLVFVPLMVGILFFLNEFYANDQLLAFMVLSVVWMAEVYSVIFARTLRTVTKFPRIFLLYFIIFHIYVFTFPFGFAYLALFTTVLFLEHSMYYFWYRYELPALSQGLISPSRPRMIAGETIGQSLDDDLMHSNHSVGSNGSTTEISEINFRNVVLEDEIEMSRRIQQQQMIALFLASEVRNPTTSPTHTPSMSTVSSPERPAPHPSGNITAERRDSRMESTFRMNAGIRNFDVHNRSDPAVQQGRRNRTRNESIPDLFDFASSN